jgi:hypothetical protein
MDARPAGVRNLGPTELDALFGLVDVKEMIFRRLVLLRRHRRRGNDQATQPRLDLVTELPQMLAERALRREDARRDTRAWGLDDDEIAHGGVP